MALPPFHVFGIATELYTPVAYLVTTVVYAPRTENDPLAQPVIPTGDNMVEYLKRIPCNTLMTVPTLLEQIAAEDGAIEVLKELNSVVRAIQSSPPSPWLIVSRPLVVALCQSRLATSCGLLGYHLPAVMVGRNSGSSSE